MKQFIIHAAVVAFAVFVVGMLIMSAYHSWKRRDHGKYQFTQLENGWWILEYNWEGKWEQVAKAKTFAELQKKHSEILYKFCQFRAKQPFKAEKPKV